MSNQKGFTLIELMIALVLGLLISAAAIELFTGSLLSSRMQQANDELQSSGIFGLDYIVRDIRLANYANINNPELNEQTPWGGIVLSANNGVLTNTNLPIPATAPFIAQGLLTHSVGTGEAVSPIQNQWQGLSNVDISSDQLTIQFVTPNDMMNCEGVNVQAGDYIIQRYFIRRDPATATSGTDYGLACDANTPTPAGTAAVSRPTILTGFGDAGEMIIPRVDHFTIQLGARTSTGNLAYYTVNQYRQLATTARAATPATAPPRIVSVKFAVLVRSLDDTKNSSIDLTKKISVLNQNVELVDKTKKYARRMYTTTVALRNGLGEKI